MSQSHRRLHLPLAAALCLVTAAPVVPAQTAAAKQNSFGKARPGVPLLTRAELRVCFALQERVRELGDVATREREVLDKEKAELVQQGALLNEQLTALDRTSQEAVDRYNAQASERDRRIDAFEARMPAFNEKVEGLARERATWSRQCENRRYDEIDEIQIKRGK